MANILNTWAIETGREDGARAVELLAMPTEDGAGSFWVDLRDVCGRLVASEPFGTQREAREHALRIVYGIPRNRNILAGSA